MIENAIVFYGTFVRKLHPIESQKEEQDMFSPVELMSLLNTSICKIEIPAKYNLAISAGKMNAIAQSIIRIQRNNT